jgi:hypothetical protein
MPCLYHGDESNYGLHGSILKYASIVATQNTDKKTSGSIIFFVTFFITGGFNSTLLVNMGLMGPAV